MISSAKYDPFGRRILKISKPCTAGTPTSDQTLWTFTYYVNDASGNVMATYDYERQADYYSMKLDEQMIYGSSRLGLRKYNKLLSTFTISGSVLTDEAADETQRYCGKKRYEYTNHLGNVLLVTTDRKMSQDPNTNGTTDYYHAVIDAYTDYGPYGNVLDGRNFGSGRYGFNGQESDPELYGANNATSAEYWMYDARLGRRWNVDPVVKVWESSYATFSNNPIVLIDPQGLNADWYKDLETGKNVYIHGATGEIEGYEWILSDPTRGLELNETCITAKRMSPEEYADTDPSLDDMMYVGNKLPDDERVRLTDRWYHRQKMKMNEDYKILHRIVCAIVLAPALAVIAPSSATLTSMPAVTSSFTTSATTSLGSFTSPLVGGTALTGTGLSATALFSSAFVATGTERAISGGINILGQLSTNGGDMRNVDMASVSSSVATGNPFIGSALSAPIAITLNDGIVNRNANDAMTHIVTGSVAGAAHNAFKSELVGATEVIGLNAVRNIEFLSGMTINTIESLYNKYNE